MSCLKFHQLSGAFIPLFQSPTFLCQLSGTFLPLSLSPTLLCNTLAFRSFLTPFPITYQYFTVPAVRCFLFLSHWYILLYQLLGSFLPLSQRTTLLCHTPAVSCFSPLSQWPTLLCHTSAVRCFFHPFPNHLLFCGIYQLFLSLLDTLISRWLMPIYIIHVEQQIITCLPSAIAHSQRSA